MKRRYHFHAPGLMYIVVTLFLAIGAINSQNNLLFASLGLAMGGLLVSGILSGASLLGVRLERLPLEPCRVGRRSVIEYKVRNVNHLLPVFGLTITELAKADEPPTWPRHVRPVRAFVACVSARDEARARVMVEPRRRGRMTLGAVRIWTTFPFGLAKKSITLTQTASTVVHAVELPVRTGILERLTVRATSGVGAAVAAGLGDEFYGLREYADGDNPRWIAWRRSARTGQLVVRQNTMPTPRVLWIVLRLPVAAEAIHVERAIAMTSSLARACIREGAAVGLAIPSHGVVMPPRTSARAVQAMQDRLALLEAEEAVVASEAEFPGAAVRAAAHAVVHAGPVDSSFGNGRTRHIGVEDMTDLLVPGEGLARAMVALDRSVEVMKPAGRRRGVTGAIKAVMGGGS